MPLFMDRHDVSKEVTAENVAQLHQEDLKIQSQYGCKGLTYWFDDIRKTAFCLIEAPNADAIKEMHKNAHGDVPHEVIEVDANIVESFLGRIEDPAKSQNVELNIINDPAFRCIMAISFPIVTLKESDSHKANIKQRIVDIIDETDSRIVNYDYDGFLASFTNVSKAIDCALQILSKCNKSSNKIFEDNTEIQIGISTGVPVNKQSGFFQATIQTSKRLCLIHKLQVVITAEVKELYESENLNKEIDAKYLYTLDASELSFLNNLMEFIEKYFSQEKLSVDDFTTQLGYSKSQYNRKMISLLGKSPKNFLTEYRLNKSLQLLNSKDKTVSEIAFDVGFSSPSYFSKCFIKRYGKSPLDYKSKKHF